MMSTEIFEPTLSPVYKHSTSNIAMSSPKMSQIFYCHQEQWIQYFATARNIPDSMISYASVDKLRVVTKNVIASSDDLERARYRNFLKAQIENRMIKSGHNEN